jgi:hypothetical protein
MSPTDRHLGENRWEVNRNTTTRTFALAADARIYLRGGREPVDEASLEQRLAASGGSLRIPVYLLHADGGTDGDVVLLQEEMR